MDDKIEKKMTRITQYRGNEKRKEVWILISNKSYVKG
jgi:hypothetical protein